jgi:glycosyltransferase involved in cell wall biosynthesis
MNILFLTERFTAGSCMMRGVWPAMWIDKFTDHNARVIDQYTAAQQQSRYLIHWADLVVIHKQHQVMMPWAELAKENGKVLVFDTDDLDEIGFDNYYNGYYLLGYFENMKRILELADGCTVSAKPIADRIDFPNAFVVENGFDVTLPCYSVTPKPYFSNPEQEFYKIAWGGGTSHGRDFEWFFKSGIIEELNETYPIDWFIYGLDKWYPHKRPIGKGSVSSQHGVDVELYINNLFSNASFLIAPLLQDDFNGCRSTLKLVEAGLAGKTIVASKVESYEQYKGVKGVTLVDNSKEEWIKAVTEMIEDKPKRREMEAINQTAVYNHYSAQVLTEKRVRYFETLMESK